MARPRRLLSSKFAPIQVDFAGRIVFTSMPKQEYRCPPATFLLDGFEEADELGRQARGFKSTHMAMRARARADSPVDPGQLMGARSMSAAGRRNWTMDRSILDKWAQCPSESRQSTRPTFPLRRGDTVKSICVYKPAKILGVARPQLTACSSAKEAMDELKRAELRRCRLG